MKDGGSSQKLMLFMRGNAMSGAPIISGTNQLPNPPISAGMTTKKTMVRPCAVTTVFQRWPFGVPSGLLKNCTPGCSSSARMATEKAAPMKAVQIANTRYIVPMSLWFVLYSHRLMPVGV